MPRKRIYLMILGGCLALYCFARADFVFAGSLNKYLGQRLVVGSIKYVPVTLRDGMESQKSMVWPSKDLNKVFSELTFKKNDKKAKKIGIDLKDHMDSFSVAGYENNIFYFLFYDFVTAVGCPNDYVIRRTKLDKTHFDASGFPRRRDQYLVEAFPLNGNKETLRAIENQKAYKLGEYSRRKIIIDEEIGCGKIPKVLEGKGWPNPENKLYYKIQNYSDVPGLYDKVEFDFSFKSRITIEFDQDGEYSFELPSEEAR